MLKYRDIRKFMTAIWNSSVKIATVSAKLDTHCVKVKTNKVGNAQSKKLSDQKT